MNIQEKAKRTRAVLAEITPQFPSGDCVLVSLDNPTYNTVGGRAMEVSLDIAARHLVENTHRLAKPEEADFFHLEQEEAGKNIRRQAAAKQLVNFVQVDQTGLPVETKKK